MKKIIYILHIVLILLVIILPTIAGFIHNWTKSSYYFLYYTVIFLYFLSLISSIVLYFLLLPDTSKILEGYIKFNNIMVIAIHLLLIATLVIIITQFVDKHILIISMYLVLSLLCASILDNILSYIFIKDYKTKKAELKEMMKNIMK